MLYKSIIVAVIAGFLTGCGASGGAQPDPDPVSNNRSSQAAISSTPTSTTSSKATSVAASQNSSMTTSRASSVGNSVTASSRSSLAMSSVVTSSRSSMVSSSLRSSSSSSAVGRQVTIQWSHPNQRENGDFLELNEIGGYEIRTRPLNSAVYSYFTIQGNQTTSYVLNNYVSTTTVEIAVFDNKGLYSQFVTVSN